MTDQPNPNVPVKMFDDASGMALAAANDAAAVARATQEIQAALVIAQRAPRDEVRARHRILQACSRKDLADIAEYEYSRGGTKITGPTIDLLRAIANRWGNLRFGWSEVERKDGYSLVRCFAWDLQSNGQAERTFSVRHWVDTREGGRLAKDEREIYELLANMAARRVRACLEEIIDADVVNAAVDQCRLTMRSGEKESPKEAAAKMLLHFMEFGVTQVMLETRLGNKLDAISMNQLASLRRVYKSLKDGVGVVTDYFKPETSKPEFTTSEAATSASTQQKAETQLAPGESAAEMQSSPAPSAAPPPAPAPEKLRMAAPAPPAEPPNQLKLLRVALQTRKFKEALLLDFWNRTGATDGSLGTLEEVQISSPKLIEHTVANWGEVSAKLEEAKTEAAKKP